MRYFTGEQYKIRYQPELDSVDPFQHYVQYGKNEGRDIAFPFDDPAQYLEANPDVKNDSFWGSHPDLHWLLAGAEEGRPYRNSVQPEPNPVIPQPQPLPGPYPSGLTEVGSFPGDEIFCTWIDKQGNRWCVTYGLHTGGAKVLKNGKVVQILTEYESGFTILDGILATEFYASLFILEGDLWVRKYRRARRQDLMLGLVRRANSQYVGLWTGWDNLTSGLVYSTDKEHWTDGPVMTGRAFSGICAVGDKIYLAGRVGNAQAVCDEQGKVVSINADHSDFGFWYWGVEGEGDFIFATTWDSNKSVGGYIDIINVKRIGEKGIQVYDNDNDPHRYGQEIVKDASGRYWCVFTNDWDAPITKNTILLSWLFGEKPKEVMRIPLPHVMNLFLTPDGGLDICGGRYGDYGKVLHWRP